MKEKREEVRELKGSNGGLRAWEKIEKERKIKKYRMFEREKKDF